MQKDDPTPPDPDTKKILEEQVKEEGTDSMEKRYGVDGDKPYTPIGPKH